MDRTQVMDIILQTRLAVVICLNDLSTFQPLAEALIDGGVRALEFTLTNRDALHAVEQLRKALPVFDSGGAAIGIGSVRNAEHVREAIEAGAQFLVSPIFFDALVTLGKQHDVVTAPGTYTPTEMAAAWDAGADVVKVFPADSLGASYLKAVLAPLPDMRLMPTGGINLENVGAYFKAGCVAVGVGSSLIDPGLIARKDWHGLRDRARAYSQACARPT